MVYECHSADDRFASRRLSSYAYGMLAILTMTSKLAALISAAAAGARVACRTYQDQATFSPVSAVHTWQVA